MTGFRTILFDLDGTLTDPSKGIFNSFRYALAKLGITEEHPETMVSLIGPPLQVSFEKRYGLQGESIMQAVSYYREYFGEKGLLENKIYDGIPQLLAQLKGIGKKVFLASTKAGVYADRILEHFNIRGFFDYLSCATFDGSRVDKSEIIAHALQKTGSTRDGKVVMVGDRKFDIIGARQNGLAAIGVTYGFGSKEELAAHHPDYLVSSVSALHHLLLYA
jgi:phosphoglycolate phosphatase